MSGVDDAISVGLNGVILTANPDHPQVLIVPREQGDVALPFGPFDPVSDRTFEIGLRRWVAEQARFVLGYVEQLYTFGDLGREAPLAELEGAGKSRVISISYLGLTDDHSAPPEGGGVWRDIYDFFPWEDWRKARPPLLDSHIIPRLNTWADAEPDRINRAARHDRIRTGFGDADARWNEERLLDRFELLYEAGLIEEAVRDGQIQKSSNCPGLGEAMASDHRRILATALSRLRGKVKYRPVVFELMPETFTLSHLQHVLEGIVGYRIHKQNFRRSLDRMGFVEGTGEMESATGGRPAELHRYRREAVAGMPSLGLATPRL
jgi:hypothetical protein